MLWIYRSKVLIRLRQKPPMTIMYEINPPRIPAEQNILNTKIVHVDYPFGAGITGLQKQLEKIIENELL